ncbi:Arc family DNA-binding protein [Stenotrophomonas sp. STM01]|uniref:Arc family DNA-binding protein n=1 Tax=Stenotrophomonas sp. STM01 TaxID=2769278 RepID=UPI00177D60D6|nr:Arc family DNA-binding protein [Stenotrophomonas sp. STM01]MBD9534636.1 Arc family DNA-binding protein [Stenotrophomonas sp. STM01]
MRPKSQIDFVKTALRLPPELHAQLHASAKEEGRTYNAEILARLERSFEPVFRYDEPLRWRMALAGHREVSMSTAEILVRSKERLLDLMEHQVEIDPLTERRGKPETVKARLEKVNGLLRTYHEQLELTTELLGEIAMAEIDGKPLDEKEIMRRVIDRQINVAVAD